MPPLRPTYTIARDQTQYLRKHFSELDLNGDGHVTVSELSLMFKALKVKIEPETLKQLVRQADANGNGQIEFDEFVTLACQLKETDSTAWAQLLRRTKPGKMERAASATAEFFGVRSRSLCQARCSFTAAGCQPRGAPHTAGNAAPVFLPARRQSVRARFSFLCVANLPRSKSKSQQSMNGSAPPPLNKRQKTVSAFKSFVGIDQVRPPFFILFADPISVADA